MQFPDVNKSGAKAKPQELPHFERQYNLRGRSEYCDAMLAELEKMKITKEGEANHYFCTLSPTAKKIFEVEPPYVETLPWEYSHYKKCQDFLKKYKVKEWKDMPW